MDKIQQLIIDTFNDKPRHFVQILKRNKEVEEYIKQHCSHITTSYLEKLYYAAYRKINICPLGKVQPLKTFKGYSFCGKTGACDCAKKSVSKNVSATKKLYTKLENDKINSSRVATNLLLYEVSNTGQTSTARQAHSDFYDDEIKVADVINRIKATKLKNHGDEKYNNRIKAVETCLEKYKVKNPWSLRADKQNPLLNYLEDKAILATLFPRYSVEEISDMLNVHVQTVYRYLALHKFRDPYRSTFEKEIVFYLNSLGITNIITNNRKILGGKELDIFLPDYNLAIEYNGIYWHHDQVSHITRQYHYDKFKKCESLGIDLFSIFSDSWEDKKDAWKNKISAKVGIFENTTYARNTKTALLTPTDTKTILEFNHVQGYSTSEICYGLIHDNEIVAVMTFSKPRPNIGKDRGNNSYELVRYVTTHNVPGGASKLLTHFRKIHNPEFIYSYSNNMYSVGKLYNKLGFLLETEHKAGYWYYSPTARRSYHRSNFSKYKLINAGFDKNSTESEIMYNRGYLRLWDCGTKTWILNLKKEIDE